MRYGDILLSINGLPTGSWDDFLQARAQCGNKLSVRVFREGTEFDVSLTLRASNASPLELLEELQTRGILPSDESHDEGLDQ
jgi:S1-C subfamily serine protease